MKPEIKSEVIKEVERLIPADRIKSEYRSLYSQSFINEATNEVLKAIPDNLDIDLLDGSLAIVKREETQPEGLEGILRRSQVNLTREELPTFEKLFETALNESCLRDLIK